MRGRDARVSPEWNRPVCATTIRWPMRRSLPAQGVRACMRCARISKLHVLNNTHVSSPRLPPGVGRDNNCVSILLRLLVQQCLRWRIVAVQVIGSVVTC